MAEFPARSTKKLNGKEPITDNLEPIGFDVSDFWSWSSSELLGNALRGKFAEYLVSIDLSCQVDVREEWDAYDLVTENRIKVEVKSSSFLQSWNQTNLSKLSIGIN